MNKKYVVVLESLGVDEKQFAADLEQKTGLQAVFAVEADPIATSDVVGLVTVKTPVTADTLEQYPNTQWVAVAFTGYDCVDLEACKEKGVTVMNVPTYATESVAELVVGLAVSLLRTIPAHDAALKTGGWTPVSGQQLAGKTVGIIGTGAIGILTAKYFSLMGCDVVGWSRSESEEFFKYGSYVDSLSELATAVDIVSVHLPLSETTRGVIDSEFLQSMKSSAFLINTARGPVIDEDALVTALQNEQIGGAALDVFTHEPLSADSPLRTLPNVILVPHIAFNTEQALDERARVTQENIASAQSDQPSNVVSK